MANSDHYFPLDATIIFTYLKNLTLSQIKVHLVRKHYLPPVITLHFCIFFQCDVSYHRSAWCDPEVCIISIYFLQKTLSK